LNTVPKRYGRTDGQTDRRLTVALPRSALASRGKNLGAYCYWAWAWAKHGEVVEKSLRDAILTSRLHKIYLFVTYETFLAD